MTYPDQHYQDIADLVRDERQGHGKLIAELYGVTEHVARGWIKRAREKGFLEKLDEQDCQYCGGTGKRARTYRRRLNDPAAAQGVSR